MALVVTGISQNGDLSALEGQLKGAALPLDPLQVVGPDDSDEESAGNLVGTTGPNILVSDVGTAVPGLTSSGTEIEPPSPEPFRSEGVSDRLGDLEIPEDEIANYVDALHSGRTVVAYFATRETLGRVEEIFRRAGLAKVKTF